MTERYTPNAPALVVLLACLALLVPSVVVGGVWEGDGPPGGSVVSLAFDPSDTDTIFIGAEVDGLFKSTNGGVNWTPVDGPWASSERVFLSIVFDSGNPDVMVVCVATSYPASGLVYRSTNGGTTWQYAGVSGCRVLAAAPSSPGTMYVSLGSGTGGIRRSLDGGATWNLQASNIGYIYGLTVDPINASVLYAATGDNGIIKSVDGGANWTAANTGIPTTHLRAVAVDATDPTHLYAGTADGRVYVSGDGASSWVLTGSDVAGGIVKAIAIHPTVGTIVYVAGYDGIAKSIDGGNSWSLVFDESYVSAIALEPGNPARIIAASNDLGVAITDDAGASWELEGPPWIARGVALDPSSPSILYAASAATKGLYRTWDEGVTWQRLPINGLTYDVFWDIAVDPNDSDTLYASGWGATNKSTDGGLTWGPVNLGGRRVELAPSGLYGYGGALVRSVDGGATSQNIAPPTGIVEDIAVVDANTIYAAVWNGSSGVQKTVDGGVTWAPTAFVGDSFAVAADPTQPNVVYAQNGSAVFRTSDGGATWSLAFDMLGVVSLWVDPAAPDRLYAAGGTAVVVARLVNGSFVTSRHEFEGAPVLDMAVDAPGGRLFVATAGSGVLRLVPVCQDGFLDPGEGCDDGNAFTGDCCAPSCVDEANGSPCEDGLFCTASDTCSAAACVAGGPRDCSAASGTCATGECNEAQDACEPAPQNGGPCSDGSACTTSDQCVVGQCVGTSSLCGDGNISLGCLEECDDGGTTDGNGCSATCRVETGWSCSGTPSVCVATCGNGVVDAGEACDDGDLGNLDGCTATCTVEPGWTCSGSPSVCAAVCGDGIRVGNEQCDAGDADDGDADGCEANCTLTPKTVTANTTPAGTVSSDLEGNGATALDPLETGVTTPTGGTVSITRQPTSGTGGVGFGLLGQELIITAPPATAAAPLRFAFTIDPSLASGLTPANIPVFRNGAEVPACTGTAGEASPDPCVTSRGLLANGEDIEIVVLTSAASTWTFAVDVCGTAPRVDCRAPIQSGKASFQIKNAADPAKDQLQWKWLKGAATSGGDLGDPTAATDYTLCVYDAGGLHLRLAVPPAGTCAGKACWAAKPGSFSYKDKDGAANGVQQLQLKAGVPAGKAKIQMKAKGGDMSLPTPLAITPPLIVQLHASNGTCWGATYSSPSKNDPASFAAKAD
ncbi:MAG: DUF4215 domain-containing protein [Deltaproteobacteria bacterium]|nr:DUF4215 domain-containing protein [Deltaproteobacteria bacterium]